MRRPIPSLTLLYALCAATLLAFQAEFLEALGELRSIEDLQFQSEVVDSVKLFKESSNTFDYFWEKEGCMLMGDKLRCHEPTTLQDSLFPTIVQEFCRLRPSKGETNFQERVQSCRTSGVQLLRWDSKSAGQRTVYCGCWVAVFDLIGNVFFFASSMILNHWMSVLCVLYVAIEPTLLKTNPRSQWDIWCFCCFGTFFAVAKVACIVFFPKGDVTLSTLSSSLWR